MLNDEIDAKFGFERCKDPAKLVGWLINMHPVSFDWLAYMSSGVKANNCMLFVTMHLGIV